MPKAHFCTILIQELSRNVPTTIKTKYSNNTLGLKNGAKKLKTIIIIKYFCFFTFEKKIF